MADAVNSTPLPAGLRADFLIHYPYLTQDALLISRQAGLPFTALDAALGLVRPGAPKTFRCRELIGPTTATSK